jgi:hypothetical protein
MALTFQLKLEPSETDGSLRTVEHRSSGLVKQKLTLKCLIRGGADKSLALQRGQQATGLQKNVFTLHIPL